jgi:cysteine-rich repeat protein
MFQYSFFTLSVPKKCPDTHPLRGQNSSNDTVCFDECRGDQYLVYNSTLKSLVCTDCNMSHCKTCVAAGKCNSCFDGYTFDSVNYNCTLSPGFCLNSQNQSQKCEDAMPNCLNCSSNTSCTHCKSGFYLNTSNLCSPCSNLTADCTLCNSTHCTNCALPKVLINATLCSLPMDPQPLPTPNGVSATCKDPNCISCQTTNSSICLLCSSSLYELQNGQCVALCGDGIIFGTDVCDDGNQISFDGCSADCQTLESGFVCNNIPSQMSGFSMTECYLNRTVTLTVASIEKPLNENKVNLYFKNPEPMVAAWKDMEINNELTKAFTLKIPRFDSGVPGYFFNYTASFAKSPEIINKLRLRAKNLSPSDLYSQKFLSRNLQSSTTSPVFLPEQYEFILLEILYSPDAPGSVPQPEISKESLNHQTMSLSFDPKMSQRSIFTKNQSPLLFASSFTLKADDNQVIQFYDQSYYQKLGLIELFSMAIGFSCILLIAIGLLSFCVDSRNSKQMLVAVETSFVVQLTYFSLLGLGEINPMFLNMASGLKLSTGYDLMVDEEGSQTFRELSGMGVESAAIASNVNVSLMLVLLCQVVGGVFLLLDKFAKKQPKS